MQTVNNDSKFSNRFRLGWIGLLLLFLFTVATPSTVHAQCSPPLAFPPCNGTGTFTGNLGIPSGVAQGICLGLADTLPIEVTTIGVADSVIICWPFGSPAVESFSSNVNSIFKRKIPYNPDTVCVASITATIYAVWYQNCAGTMTVVAKKNISYDLYPKPKAQFTLTNDTLCLPDPPVTFTPTCLLPSGYVTHHWDFGVTSITSDTSNISVPQFNYSPYPQGTYNVVHTVSHLVCPNTDTFNLNVYIANEPTPQIVANPDSICPGTQSVLFAGAGYSSYLWSNGSTNDSITVSNAGNYTVTVTNALGCTASTDTAIIALPGANPNITGPASTCSGSTGTLDAGGGYSSYLWSNGSTSQTITVPPGNYTVTVTNSSGCTGTDTFTIGTATNLTPTITATPICGVTNGTLDAGGPYATYQWSNGLTTQTISVSTPGTYTVTVTAAGGCSGSASSTIALSIVPVPAILGNDTICQGQNTTLTVGAFASYSWNSGATTSSINVSAGGAYTVTVTNAAGCTGTASFLVTLIASPNVSITGDSAVCAGGNSVLDAGPGFASYLWSNGASTQTISVATTNTYTVTVTNAGGCPDTDAFVFTVNPNPTPVISGQTSICSGTSASLDAGLYVSYLWNTGSTSNPLSTGSPGVYTVTVTNANGCTGTDTDTVAVNSNPSATITPQAIAICAGQSTTLTANAGFNYLWSTGATTQSISINNNSTYTVTITDNNGCSDDASTSITVNPVPTPALQGDTTVCSGDTYALTVPPPNYSSYLWSNGGTTNSIVPSTTGYYVVTVTNASGCTATIGTNFFLYSKPSINIMGNDTICQGATSILNAGAGAGYTYVWSTGATTQTISVAFPNTYTVTVTDIHGCKDTSDILFVVNPLPNVVITGDTVTCANQPIVLSAGSTYQQYLWNNGTTDSTITPNVSGIYVVTVTDGNGCTKSDQASVTVNPIPVPTVSSVGYYCFGSSVLVNCGSGFNNYLWSNGDSTQNIYVSSVGWYAVVVTDGNGCTGTDSINITQRNLPVVNIGGDPQICLGQTSILNAGAGFSGYLWSNGVTTQTNAVTTAGTYIVTVTDAFGCNNQDIFTLTVDPLPTPVITGDSEICSGQSGTLNCNSGYQSYLWSTGATTASINVVSSGTYSVTVTDLNGCTAIKTQLFTVNPLPNPVIPGNTTLCAGSTTTLSPGAGFNNYLWSTGATSSSITASTSGLYQVTVTDANGCSETASITLTFYPLPTPVITGDQTICNGETSTLNAGSGYINYVWSDGSLNQYNNATGSGIYVVTVTDSNNCVGTSPPFPLTVLFGHANITYSSPLEFCEGDSVTLVSDSALTYLWSDGSAGQSITVSGTGQYLVTVLDLNGCPAISSIVTTYQQQHPDLQVHTDSILVCSVGMNFEFTNNSNFEPGSQWLWDFGDGNYSNEISPEHIYDTPGQYLVTYQCISPIGCNGADSIPVTVQFEPIATADFTISTEVNHIFGIPFQFTDASTNATSWNWEFGDGGVGTGQLETHRYSEIKQYFVTLTVTNTDGCESDTTKPLFVSPVYVPNAFTPDGDGKNDTFYEVGYGTGPFQMDVDCYEMLIFNRWGQLVYRTNSPNRPWDGTMSNGKPAPFGVYVYKILIEIKADNEVNHVKETFVGTVTLLR